MSFLASNRVVYLRALFPRDQGIRSTEKNCHSTVPAHSLAQLVVVVLF